MSQKWVGDVKVECPLCHRITIKEVTIPVNMAGITFETNCPCGARTVSTLQKRPQEKVEFTPVEPKHYKMGKDGPVEVDESGDPKKKKKLHIKGVIDGHS